jgi:NTE family protein
MRRPTIGLILTGGGARAAYQVGVLAAVARMLPPGAPSPFQVICGTSAGALNAAIIAQDAACFARGVKHALRSWVALRASIRVRRLHALCVTASSYDSGQSVSFFEGLEGLQPWSRARRRGVRTTLGPEPVMGSMAMPFMYPPERIAGEHFGDGAIQQISPISPAIQLGADKVLIIGVGRCASPGGATYPALAYPSIGQISGHLFESIFVDTLEADLERLHQVNETLTLIPPRVRARAGLRQRIVQACVVNPGHSLDALAANRIHRPPPSIRLLLRAIGALRDGRTSVLSYLLTEAWYSRSLMRRGYRDAMARRDELARFLEQPLAQPAMAARRSRAASALLPPDDSPAPAPSFIDAGLPVAHSMNAS